MITRSIVVCDKTWLGPATSCVYLAKLTVVQKGSGSDGIAHFIPFVVRAPITRRAEVALLVPDITWQAYNS